MKNLKLKFEEWISKKAGAYTEADIYLWLNYGTPPKPSFLRRILNTLNVKTLSLPSQKYPSDYKNT